MILILSPTLENASQKIVVAQNNSVKYTMTNRTKMLQKLDHYAMRFMQLNRSGLSCSRF